MNFQLHQMETKHANSTTIHCHVYVFFLNLSIRFQHFPNYLIKVFKY